MTQQLHSRGGVVMDDGANGDESRTMAAAAVETPVESRMTTGVAQRRRLPVASAHPQIGLGFFNGFGGARRTSYFVCRRPPPLFIAQRNRGPPTIKGWTPPIRARIKGLIGRWAY